MFNLIWFITGREIEFVLGILFASFWAIKGSRVFFSAYDPARLIKMFIFTIKTSHVWSRLPLAHEQDEFESIQSADKLIMREDDDKPFHK